MARELKSTGDVLPGTARAQAAVDVVSAGQVALVTLAGPLDERFGGFGHIGQVSSLVIDVSNITQMTSFGVRQWLKGMDVLPKSITNLYLLGCPTFFVDQLNMVLNFGGHASVLTAVAPYSCPSCGVESGELIDMLAERANLTKGVERWCSRCSGKLQLDETPESYFAFARKYAASGVEPATAALLAQLNLYTPVDTTPEKPPRITKLVHGPVTYFRIIGTIGSKFRARPFLVGADGEVVIDLAEVDRFEAAGQKEWRGLLKSLAGQASVITLVDVNEGFLASSGDSLAIARNIAIASLLAPYRCIECGHSSSRSVTLVPGQPPRFEQHVCAACGGISRNQLPAQSVLPLQRVKTTTPAASAKVIQHREELLSRALTDANVAHGGQTTVPIADTMLGKYKIVRRLSAGGMAEVFLANQIGIGGFEKPVALKRIQHNRVDSRRQAIELFLNEAKIAGRLMHPNIVQVLDVGEVGGALYLAMEYVHGKDLREVAKRLRSRGEIMPLGEACYVVREVAQALDHAYWSTDMAGNRLSVVHRDVSPHNIILGYDGTVKLLDFGVAMSAITEHGEKLIVGKWTYMSPETTMNGQTDHRSDLFSLGVILYLLCSGSLPFEGSDPKQIVRRIRTGQYRPLAEIAPDVPDRLAALVSQMLAPNPDHRPQRGHEVVAELNEIARRSRFESDGDRIADFLETLFPLAGTADDQTVLEATRAFSSAPSAQRRNSGYLFPSNTLTAASSTHLVEPSDIFGRSSGQISGQAERSGPFSSLMRKAGRASQIPRFAPNGRSTGQAVVSVAIAVAIVILLGIVLYVVESSL